MRGVSKMKSFIKAIKKLRKLFASLLAFIISGFGFAFSIYGMINSSNNISAQHINILLFISELLLLVLAIYFIFQAIFFYVKKDNYDKQEYKMKTIMNTQEKLLENNKTAISNYKEFIDQFRILIDNTKSKNELNKTIYKLSESDEVGNNEKRVIADFKAKTEITELNNLCGSLVTRYNRFLANTFTYLQNSIEEYFDAKGLRINVAIALKQLYEPTYYSELNDMKSDIYTAFRDRRTYESRKRNETWEKPFCIKKNSDFVLSIARDYCIFNYEKKSSSNGGLYRNENENFYENYNSGVTVSIYTCFEGKRKLFGFLACDSLITSDQRRKLGDEPFDYNIANMMAASSNIIALFLDDFLEIWKKYIIQSGLPTESDEKYKQELEKRNKTMNFCQHMIDTTKNSKYNG